MYNFEKRYQYLNFQYAKVMLQMQSIVEDMKMGDSRTLTEHFITLGRMAKSILDFSKRAFTSKCNSGK